MKKTTFRRRLQRGLTLIELLVVVVIIGVIAVIGGQAVGDSQKMADYLSFYTTADRIAQQFRMLTTRCQTTSDIGNAPITASPTAAKNLQVLVDGNVGDVDTAYKGCFQMSKLEPLSRLGVRGSAGAYTFNGRTMTVSNISIGGQNRVATKFAGVDDAIALELIQKYGSRAGASAKQISDITAIAADETSSTDASVFLTNAASGTHDVTIVR